MQKVTPTEAISLGEHLTTEPLQQARDIYQEALSHELVDNPNDPIWAEAVALATLFNAGVVQGIRVERTKKRRQA